MKFRKYAAWWPLTSVLLLSTVGCGAFSTPSTPSQLTWKPSSWFKKDFQEPMSLATIWKADTLTEPGQQEQRGFGARVYFYNDRSQSIPVEGDLVVHGFLTTPSSRQQADEQADKKFTFSAEQLAGQYSPTDLGASYSIWVPWDADGGFREEVTLVATFKSKGGAVVQGAPTRLFLPGQARLSEDLKLPEAVQQVSYQKSSILTYDIQATPPKSQTRITTIDVPDDSQLRRDSQGVRVGGGEKHDATDASPTTGKSRQRF